MIGEQGHSPKAKVAFLPAAAASLISTVNGSTTTVSKVIKSTKQLKVIKAPKFIEKA
jgi:hypothetical protein